MLGIPIYFIIGVVLLKFAYPILEDRQLSGELIVIISIIWSLIVPLIIFVTKKVDSHKYPIIKSREKNSDNTTNVLVSDGKFDISCIHIEQGVYEIEYMVGSILTQPILIRDIESIKITLNGDPKISQSYLDDNYNICARVLDPKTPSVSCGKFKFIFDRSLPKEIDAGDFICIVGKNFFC